MSAGKSVLPARGAQTAEEIFLAVGSALFWWEASEDMLMGLFKTLCAVREPTAFETYVASNRATRGRMLKSALERYSNRLTEDEHRVLRKAIKELDKLAALRNEIAHGHCSNFKHTDNGVVTMEGCYLLPSLNEQGWHERALRYAHTADSIREFEKNTRTLEERRHGHLFGSGDA